MAQCLIIKCAKYIPEHVRTRTVSIGAGLSVTDPLLLHQTVTVTVRSDTGLRPRLFSWRGGLFIGGGDWAITKNVTFGERGQNKIGK